jgi:NhaC family Na+:H+ antiporter
MIEHKKPGFVLSLIPVVLLVFFLTINVVIYSDNATYGPNQLALLIASACSAFIGVFILKQDYKVIEKKALEAVSVSLQACLILLIVGCCIQPSFYLQLVLFALSPHWPLEALGLQLVLSVLR